MQDLQTQRLQQMAIFGGISDETMDFLLARARIAHAAAGSHFVREGDAATGLFVLLEGRVAIQRRWNDHQMLLGELDPGDCFGEMALLDLGPRSASVHALQESSALELSTELLHQLFERDPRQFALIQMNIARELSRRLRNTINRLFAAADSDAERALIEKILRRT
ncbi:MAG TPA: cyclic nucleotide-binding domain-containing protein [Variovorax sp.]|nr:cyclic nucleotide-binding domain-containing protein [Variovorax sp.]